MARALPAISARTGTAALRAGRPGLGLAALHLARRPGTNRIFAVLAVSVAVFTTVVLFEQTATTAWQARAEQELGAARVLDVRATSSAHLLQAVRAVDPEGRYAMAVARTEGVRTEDRVVAVDTTRLARVALVKDTDWAQRPAPAGPGHADHRRRPDHAGRGRAGGAGARRVHGPAPASVHRGRSRPYGRSGSADRGPAHVPGDGERLRAGVPAGRPGAGRAPARRARRRPGSRSTGSPGWTPPCSAT